MNERQELLVRRVKGWEEGAASHSPPELGLNRCPLTAGDGRERVGFLCQVI